MAMKPRTPTSQGQPSLRPVYEDFQPNTELTENREAHFLHIHLPGFTRDQIKISFMHSARTLNVSGERPIDSENYRWIRFNQSYPTPQNCEVKKLQAKFNQGILTITMPKKLVSQQSPKREAQEKGPFPSKKEEPKPDKKAQEGIPPKPPTTRVEEPKPEKAQEKIPQKYTPRRGEEPKPEKAHEYVPKRHTPSIGMEEQKPEKAHEESPQRFRIPRGKYDLMKAQKNQEEGIESQKPIDERGLEALMPPGPIGESRPEKGQDETEPKPTKIRAPGKPIYEKAEEGRETQKEAKEVDGKLPNESRKPEKIFQEKEIRTRRKAPETAEKENEIMISKEDDIVGTIGKGIKQVSASTSQVVTKISAGKWNDEDKPTLVNMGAAMLVIAALGAYVSYRFASSGST